MASEGELILRLLIAAACGGILGLEREISDQPAGFRTHILVSLGACLFTVAGIWAADAYTLPGAKVRVDPTRIAAQVVTGIGFLGAGAILQQGASIKGLTTAASLWVTAAIGTAVGLGMYAGSIVAVVVAAAALLLLKPLTKKIVTRIEHRRKPDDTVPF